MSYSNSCFSEYLGCQIFEIIGIPVQKTLLGTFTVKGVEKIVVACGDFTRPGDRTPGLCLAEEPDDRLGTQRLRHRAVRHPPYHYGADGYGYRSTAVSGLPTV